MYCDISLSPLLFDKRKKWAKKLHSKKCNKKNKKETIKESKELGSFVGSIVNMQNKNERNDDQ